MSEKEFRHWKTIHFFKDNESHCYWYACKNVRVIQFCFHFGIPELNIEPYASEAIVIGMLASNCIVLGGECYYDGTSLGAIEFAKDVGAFSEIDDKRIFSALEIEWDKIFGKEEPHEPDSEA